MTKSDNDCARLAKVLAQDFPAFDFQLADRAYWSASEQIIYYHDNELELLHELGHALLGHSKYNQDIELLKIEEDAWLKAQEIAPEYGINIDNEYINYALDSYRDWMFKRSLCPVCGQTGIQNNQTLNYRCLNCGQIWHANDARSCELRRRLIK